MGGIFKGVYSPVGGRVVVGPILLASALRVNWDVEDGIVVATERSQLRPVQRQSAFMHNLYVTRLASFSGNHCRE